MTPPFRSEPGLAFGCVMVFQTEDTFILSFEIKLHVALDERFHPLNPDIFIKTRA